MADSDFKMQVLAHLSDSGTLDALKEQLRSELVKGLRPSTRPSSRKQSSKVLRRVLNSLFEEYLTVSDFQYTLSVFQPETGCSKQRLSHEDILHSLKLEPGSELHNLLRKRGLAHTTEQSHGPGLALTLLECIVELGSNAGSQRRAYEGELEQQNSVKEAEIRRLRRRQEELEHRLQSFEAQIQQLSIRDSSTRASHERHRQHWRQPEHRPSQRYDPGWQEDVYTRLRRAAANSQAVKATEAVWMGWAQQSDGLLDEMLTGREDMVRCVEEARVAVVQAEEDAQQLKAVVADLQLERQQLLSQLPDGAKVFPTPTHGYNSSPVDCNRPLNTPSRAQEMQQTERQIKSNLRALENRVLSQRQAATAQLAHVLACIGFAGPQGASGPSTTALTTELSSSNFPNDSQHHGQHPMHEQFSSSQQQPSHSMTPITSSHATLPADLQGYAHSSDSQGWRPRSASPMQAGLPPLTPTHLHPTQPAHSELPAGCQGPTCPHIPQLLQISLSNGTISFDGGATQYTLAAAPQPHNTQNTPPTSATAQAQQQPPAVEGQTISASPADRCNLADASSPAQTARSGPSKPTEPMDSPFRSRDQQQSPVRMQPAPSIPILTGLTPTHNHKQASPAREDPTIPILTGMAPAQAQKTVDESEVDPSIPILTGMAPAQDMSEPTMPRASAPSRPASASPQHARSRPGHAPLSQSHSPHEVAHPISEDPAAATESLAHPVRADQQPQRGVDESDREETSEQVVVAPGTGPAAGFHQQGYDVFAGQQPPDSPVRSASTNLMSGDAANYTLESDYGPLVLHLDAVEEVSLPKHAAHTDQAGSNEDFDAEGITAGGVHSSSLTQASKTADISDFPAVDIVAMPSSDMSPAEREEAQSRSQPEIHFSPEPRKQGGVASALPRLSAAPASEQQQSQPQSSRSITFAASAKVARKASSPDKQDASAEGHAASTNASQATSFSAEGSAGPEAEHTRSSESHERQGAAHQQHASGEGRPEVQHEHSEHYYSDDTDWVVTSNE